MTRKLSVWLVTSGFRSVPHTITTLRRHGVERRDIYGLAHSGIPIPGMQPLRRGVRKRYVLLWCLAALLTMAGSIIATMSILSGHQIPALAAIPTLATGLVLLLRQYRATIPVNEEALAALPKAGETLIVAYVTAPQLYAIAHALRTDPVVRVLNIPESGKRGAWWRIEFFTDHGNPPQPQGTGPGIPHQPGGIQRGNAQCNGQYTQQAKIPNPDLRPSR